MEEPAMTFIEIAGGTKGRVFIALTAVGRIEGKPAGQDGSTIWLLDGKSYPVREDAHQARLLMANSTVAMPSRLTLEVQAEPEPMVAFLGSG
jgi:hypothetical protein